MKRFLVITAAVMVTAATATSQPAYFSGEARHKQADLAKVEKKYVLCLQSENTGVIESALAHATYMKLICPSMEFAALQAKVNSLAATSGSPTIRYRAYLAALVFDNPDMFSGRDVKSYEDPDELFSSIASHMQVTLLGKGERKYVRAE